MVLAALAGRHSSEEPSISQVFEGLTSSFCIFKLNSYEPLSQMYRCIYSLLVIRIRTSLMLRNFIIECVISSEKILC